MKRAAGSAALGLLLLLCAATFAIRSMYVPGVTFLVLGIGFAIWVTLAAGGARLEREPGPATVEEDSPWPLRIVVSTGLVPPPGGDVIEPLIKQPLRLGQMKAGRDGKRRVRVEVRFGRRGRRVIEGARLIVRDPLGLAAREIDAVGEQGEVLVLPRIEPVLPVEGGGAPGMQSRRGREGADGGSAGRAPAPDMELDVLRPYRPGAPATRIHWPTLARTGELMERRFVADPRSRPLIVVDSFEPEGQRELDAAVRAAASLAYHLAKAGGCGILLPGDRRPTLLRQDMRSFAEVHARLALLEPASAYPAVARKSGGPIVWVTASHAIPSLPSRMGAGWIVAPHALAAGAPAEFRVGGCIGQRLAAVWKEAA